MSATPDYTLTDPEQVIADLQRQLAERTTERDEALARETAISEVLQGHRQLVRLRSRRDAWLGLDRLTAMPKWPHQ